MNKIWYYVADATVTLRDQPTKVQKRFRFVHIISSSKETFPILAATSGVYGLYHTHHCEVGSNETISVAIINQVEISHEEAKLMRITNQCGVNGEVIPL